MSNFLASTIVEHGGERFRISTIDRESSSPFAYGYRYSETLVWRVDDQGKNAGPIIAQGEGQEGDLREHFSMVERIHKHGPKEATRHDD